MSTKKVAPATQKKRLLALAGLLESLPTGTFDYSDFCMTDDTKEQKPGTDVLEDPIACGTTACAVGWAPAIPAARKLGYAWLVNEFGQPDFFKNGRRIRIDRFAKSFFGLSGKAFGLLFYPGSWLGGLHSPPSDATAEAVAEHIRNFVAIRFA